MREQRCLGLVDPRLVRLDANQTRSIHSCASTMAMADTPFFSGRSLSPPTRIDLTPGWSDAVSASGSGKIPQIFRPPRNHGVRCPSSIHSDSEEQPKLEAELEKRGRPSIARHPFTCRFIHTRRQRIRNHCCVSSIHFHKRASN